MEIDVINTIAESKLHFMLSVVLWESFDSNILQMVSPPNMWNEVKLLDSNGNINSQMKTIPNNTGGIYLFLAKTQILPESYMYLMYVGRAHFTAKQNLRKRCCQYPNENKRPRIKRMVQQWGKYLYVKYLPLTDNHVINTIEAELINKILPPFNDEIPDQNIKAAVKAFIV